MRGNPVALGLVLVGAAMMLIATFLPLYEPSGIFRMVQENTLIQHGGWLLAAAAVSIAAGGFRARNGTAWFLPLGVALLAAAGLGLFVADKGSRTLYPLSLNGAVDASAEGTVVPFSIAIYVSFAGIALAIAGSNMLRQSATESGMAATGKKKCPDCAETVLADAQVCKHCGFRFPPPPPPPPAPDRNVRCHKCGTVQKVPSTKTLTTCASCQAQMKIPV